MSTITVSLVQPNFPMSFNEDAFFLPYSAGSIWSYVKRNARQPFKLNKMIFRREPIEKTVIALAEDTVVGFSNYLWNKNYNLELAKRIKQINPSVITIFGGPDLPITRNDFFYLYPQIDAHTINEGEKTFLNLLENLESWKTVPGIIYNDNGLVHKTRDEPRIEDLSDLPSPYLDGTFDDLLKQYPDFKFHATLETNRGCPYRCTFCDWGSLTYNKVKIFPNNRIDSEIEWVFANPQVQGLFLADANFGFFPRDEEIVDKIVETRKKYPNRADVWFETNYAKNQNKNVVRMVKKIADALGGYTHHTVALQSMSDEVLNTIKRKNLAVNKIKEIHQICTDNNLSLKVEIILGLPKDTLEEFKGSFYKLFEVSPQISMQIYRLIGLNNSELTLTKQDNVEWREIKNFVPNTQDDVYETFNWVYSTDSMSHEDILEATNFSCWIIAFHSYGITNLVSQAARTKGVSYKQFYDGLFELVKQDEYFKDYFTKFTEHSKQWYETGESKLEKISDLNFSANNSLWHLASKLYYDDKFQHIFKIIKDYLIDLDVFDEQVFDIQKHIPISFNKQDAYPLKLLYNNKPVNLINSFETEKDLQQFINNIYYKREFAFGTAIPDRMELLHD